DGVEAESLGGLCHVPETDSVAPAGLETEAHGYLNLASSRRAITCSCTSSGPSASRSIRPSRHMRASGVSSETPRAPCTWIARSDRREGRRGTAGRTQAVGRPPAPGAVVRACASRADGPEDVRAGAAAGLLAGLAVPRAPRVASHAHRPRDVRAGRGDWGDDH